MTVAIGDILRVVVRTTLPLAKEALNIYHLKYTSLSPIPDATAITQIETWIELAHSHLLPFIDSNVTFQDAKVQKLDAAGDVAEEVGLVTMGQTGAAAGDMLPHVVSGLCTMFTSVPKRRGRKYIPGFSEVHHSEGLLVSGVTAALASYTGRILIAPVSGVGWQSGVISGSPAITFTPFNMTGRVTNVPGTIRNRRPD